MTLWDDVFTRRAWGRWPAEEVVRAVSRLSAAVGRPLVVLEVGCGPGPQLWYLEHEGHCAVGLDRSLVALVCARHRLRQEGCACRVTVGDAGTLPFRDGAFDLVLDVEAFSHNHEDVSTRLWVESARVLRRSGHLLSIGFTANTSGIATGTPVGARSVIDLTDGPLVGYGTVSLINEPGVHLLATAAGLEVIEVQFRSRTVGPDRWSVEEQVTLARVAPSTAEGTNANPA